MDETVHFYSARCSACLWLERWMVFVCPKVSSRGYTLLKFYFLFLLQMSITHLGKADRELSHCHIRNCSKILCTPWKSGLSTACLLPLFCSKTHSFHKSVLVIPWPILIKKKKKKKEQKWVNHDLFPLLKLIWLCVTEMGEEALTQSVLPENKSKSALMHSNLLTSRAGLRKVHLFPAWAMLSKPHPRN